MKTDLSQLVTANFDGLNFSNMGPNSLWWSKSSPVQFVPAGVIMPTKYHTKNRNQFWFSEQIVEWINQNNYWNPWQAGDGAGIETDTIPLQFFTNGLSGVVATLYDCNRNVISAITLTETASPAVLAPIKMYQGLVPLTPLIGKPGGYYLDVVAGSGGAAAEAISEGLYVKNDWPETMLFEVTSSQNKFSIIFDAGFKIVHRVKGFFNNLFKPKFKGAFYVDQPQDISVLNAITYETTTLLVGGDDGVPDYESRKILNYLLMDGCVIEGEGFSIDEGAAFEEVFTPGNPKKYQKVDIRPTSSMDGVGATAAGADSDASMIISTDATYFGPNDGSIPGDSQIIQALIT